MFKKLLVPLDGSTLAEAALAPAAYLAKRLGAAVALIHIIERDLPGEVHGQKHLNDPQDAQTYLERIAAERFDSSVNVECHVHTSFVRDVPQSIADHVDEFLPDLIVMCTHGRSGLGVRLFGSIAQQVVSLGKTPVMLVQPGHETTDGDFVCERLLVPLDGDPAHERGMRVAAGLAKACGAGLHLVTVVPTLGTLTGQRAATGKLLPGATSAMLDMSLESANRYLDGMLALMQEEQVPATKAVRRGDPSGEIVKEAKAQDVDAIVLGTHGRSGMEAFWAGSVASAVAGRSSLPLLLVPIHA
jgi:nucleotide-binding universal stress UspA family protein